MSAWNTSKREIKNRCEISAWPVVYAIEKRHKSVVMEWVVARAFEPCE